ncbi:MAG: response regulator, partial [Verrucomicrobiota bacterium]
KATRVIVFSNAFLNNTGEQLAALGVEEMLLKSAVTPNHLIETISKIFGNAEPAKVLPVQPAAPSRVEPKPAHSPSHHSPEMETRESAAAFGRRIRRDFFEQISTITRTLNQVSQDFLNATELTDRNLKLAMLSRKIGFLTHMTGMAGCHRIAQLTGAFEALLFELQEKPANINESSRHTVATTTALLADCLSRADQADEQCLSPTSILVVDDDAVSNRALLLALRRYHLTATSVLDPFAALEKLKQHSYDLALLDINLPGMDGIRLCEQMRRIPSLEKLPVIFITSYMEFEARARAVLRTGDDLIAKPILPIELTLKVISHSLKQRMGYSGAKL